MELFVEKVKTATGYGLRPCHETDLEAIKGLPGGQPLRVTMRRVRNYEFHKKYFALLNYAFDCWEPPEPKASKLLELINVPPEKNFDQFRADITILAGFYKANYRVNGEVRLEPKSISFANMDEDEFEQLYEKTIDVIIKRVLTNYTGDELRNVVDGVMEFSS